MSENMASGRSVVTRTSDKSHVSDSLAPSGYEADDERSVSLSAQENNSTLSAVVGFLNSPSTPRTVLGETGNGGNLNVIYPESHAPVDSCFEEVGDNEGASYANLLAKLSYGDKLSNNTKNNLDAVEEEEAYMRSRSLSTPDKQQSCEKRRRLAFE